MHGVGADSQLAPAAVGFLRVQDVRRLGSAVGGELVVFAMLPGRIVEADATHDVAAGGQDADPGPRRGGELRCQESSEFEVSEMICAQLYFEAILSAAERREHDTRVGHQ